MDSDPLSIDIWSDQLYKNELFWIYVNKCARDLFLWVIENCLLTNGNITELLKNVTKLDLSSKAEPNAVSKSAGNSKGDLKSLKDSLSKKSNGVKTPKDPIPGFTEFSNLRETLL